MFREPFVQKCVICLKQIEHAAIFAQHALNKEFRFLTECLPEIVIEIGKETQIRGQGIEIAQIKPLLDKIVDQVF